MHQSGGVALGEASSSIVKRREDLAESECSDWTRMLEYLPELATLRRFADRISWVFDASNLLSAGGPDNFR